jgi:phosphohistidine phosphatase
MKELFIVRHAKSDWGAEFMKDIDRPLNERGYSDAYFMSKWFLKNKKKPDLILTSTATRALSTALIFARAMEFNMENFLMNEKIYESSVANLISIIHKQNDAVNSIMLFGHNPGLTDLCNKLNDDVFIDNISTCGIVNLNFDSDSWKGVAEKKASMGFFQFPKDFKNTD